MSGNKHGPNCNRLWCICTDDEAPSHIALVCGSRTWTDRAMVFTVLDGWATGLGDGIPGVIAGGAKGADTYAEEWAKCWDHPVMVHHAQWDLHGRSAGPIRNREMIKYQPDVVFAFAHDLNTSKGTADMVRVARKAGVPTYVISGGPTL